jgi:hypothetical protein
MITSLVQFPAFAWMLAGRDGLIKILGKVYRSKNNNRQPELSQKKTNFGCSKSASLNLLILLINSAFTFVIWNYPIDDWHLCKRKTIPSCCTVPFALCPINELELPLLCLYLSNLNKITPTKL